MAAAYTVAPYDYCTYEYGSKVVLVLVLVPYCSRAGRCYFNVPYEYSYSSTLRYSHGPYGGSLLVPVILAARIRGVRRGGLSRIQKGSSSSGILIDF